MLETTVLRKDALSILAAGMDALDTDLVLRTKVSLSKEVLKVGRRKYKLSKYNRIFVLGIGKSSLGAAKTLENILGSKITDGVILDVKKGSLKYMKSIAGTHPYPSDKNIRATGEMLGILKGLDSKDLLISIISGGGSALMCWPYQLECTDVVAITRLLMKRGAEIHELNTVRKHLSEIQGGQLARLAHPATVVGLIFSDVPGDDISMVASGPTVLDTTTVADAERVLKKYDVIKECNLGECNLKETPKDPSLFSHVHNELVVTNKVALKAMQAKARVLGYRSSIFSARVDGEAKNVGELLAKLPKKGQVIIAGGETTVTVTHPGKGGRNLEVALGALKTVHEDGLVLSFASDGIDNTPIAGGLADQTTKERAARLGFDSETFLEKNQSYDFFLKTKSHIRTGVTGVNVSDLMISMRAK